MLKKILLTVILSVAFFSNFAEAADKYKVAVMDLGEFSGAYTSELSTENIGAMVSEYIVQALNKDGRFKVIERRLFEEQLKKKNLQQAGIIPAEQAAEIAKILGVDYLIYGNVNNVGGNSGIFEVVKYGGGKVHELRARLIIRMVDVKKDISRIVAAGKGEGFSKSSEVKLGDDTKFIKIGTAKIPQVSVHNAAKKAAYDAVAKLTESFFSK